MKLLEGKKLRDDIAGTLARDIVASGIKPKLVIIQVGTKEDSTRYIEQKKAFAERIGAQISHEQFSESVSANEVLGGIKKANDDKTVHGIIVQLPLPEHLNAMEIVNAIHPSKDIDGMTESNLKQLWNKQGGFVPGTTRGICTLLEHYDIDVTGKKVVVVGRSVLVGKPTALVMTNKDATVTVCHSKTKNLQEETKRADILIVAIGRPHFFTKEYVSAGQTVVDVGINLVDGKKLDEEIPRQKLVGDVDFDSVKDIAGAISPVPGGVGPLTVASLFQNLFEASKQQAGSH